MHQPHPKAFSRLFGSLALAISISVSSAAPIVFAAPGEVNSINNGQNVAGGTYYNTAGDKTTFVNTSGTGLYLKSGVTVTGLESDAAGNPTGNGGWLHFYAPGQAVRLDGTINVSALMSKGGYAGNGGRVTVDSALLYQNGAIFANGKNGGAVQFNVGSALLGPTARIDARGFAQNGEGGYGGSVSIHSPGAVDIQRGAIVDTSGRVIGTYDTNIINIEGGLINLEGVLRADGVEVVDVPARIAYEGEGGPNSAPSGGTIRLVASGATKPACLTDCVLEKSPIFTASERDAIALRQQTLVNNHDGDIKIASEALVSADGDTLQDGGTIILSAMRHVANDGAVHANGGDGLLSAESEGATADGGHGGTIAITAGHSVYNGGLIQANGGAGGGSPFSDFVSVENPSGPAHASAFASSEETTAATGGNGGLIAFSYHDSLVNSGVIQANGGAGGQGAGAYANAYSAGIAANAVASAIGGVGGQGGHGGLIVLSGYSNPTGGGRVEANGGEGGQGGDATAIATARGERSASATANAIAGAGGEGGAAGLIVAPNPATFDADQVHHSDNGAQGAAGRALAKADATSGGVSDATANATSGFKGVADAIAFASQEDVVLGGDPNATANALAGDYGVANALTSAIGRDDANATSHALAGQFGKADARATAYSQEQKANANAGALTTLGGCSVANAYALSFYAAKANAAANTGASGVSLADALAKSLNDNADAKATANSGQGGFSRANAKSIAFVDAFVDASANAGQDGYAESNAIGEAGDDVRKLKSTANSGQNGVSIATGLANTSEGSGHDVSDFSVSANSGQDGQSLAKGQICAGGDVTADVKSNAGQFGKAFAALTAHAGDDIEKAAVSATVGDAGFAKASGEVTAFDEVKDLRVSALGGRDAVALAHALATANNDVKKSDALATVGEGGFAKADAWGSTGNGADDDADVSAKALSGAHGVALAEAHGFGGDDITTDANATSGAFGFSEAKSIAEATHGANGDADATANATSGASGKARAIAYSTSGDDGSAKAKALFGAGGGGEAQISLNIDDDWSASALSGGLSNYIGFGFSGKLLDATRTSGAPVGVTPATPDASAPVTQIAVWTPASAIPSSGGNGIAQLQRNELALNGPNAILLSVDDDGFGNLTLLSERLKDARVRTVENPLSAPGWLTHYAGGGFWNEGFRYWPGQFRNLVIGSATAETLTLDQPSGRSWGDGEVFSWPAAFNSLNTLTVLNAGDLENPSETGGWTVGRANDYWHPSIAGGHLSLLSVYGAIRNDNVLRAIGDGLGGGITLAAGGRCRSLAGIVNTSVIATNPGWSLPDHGGSIILKTPARIVNEGDIDANGDAAGGTIVLRTCGDILNTGTIKAMAAGLFGRRPYDLLRDEAYDEAYTDETPSLLSLFMHATGGIILSEAGGVNANHGQMLVDGDVFGARGDGGYLLQYGGKRAINCGLLSANGNDQGNGGLVLLVSGRDAINNGTIRTLGGPAPDLNDGLIVLAGNRSVRQGPGSQLLGNTRILVGDGDESGLSAVELALCNPISLPGGGRGTPKPRVTRGPDYDVLGLFQEDRRGPLDRIPTLFRLVIRIPDPGVMLSSAYLPVTEEILALALEDFHRQLSMGQTIAEARRHAMLYLREAGVTRQVAQALVERAAQGGIKADSAIVKALETMAKAPDSTNGGLPLVQ